MPKQPLGHTQCFHFEEESGQEAAWDQGNDQKLRHVHRHKTKPRASGRSKTEGYGRMGKTAPQETGSSPMRGKSLTVSE